MTRAGHGQRQPQLDRLDATWASPPGLIGWFMPVNQRVIGRRFIVTAFVFFFLSGILALLMRLQLARPGNDLLTPEVYNQLFTVHGTAMMFLFAIPVMEGLMILMVPMMIGTRDMAFPRLNAFGYYVYLIGGVIFFASLFLGLAPAAGWFNYVPLSNAVYSPGYGVGIWTTMITFIEISALTAAVELIVTILKLRAPGMSLDRMPLFVWASLVTAFMIVFAMPAVIAASSFLLMDRQIGTHFFSAVSGGKPLLWQHLFWFFGHPEVYIILVPALGIVSSVIAASTGRPLYGYPVFVLSVVATGFLGFGLWVHHMFTTGLPLLGMTFFMVASMVIAIPSGLQVFCWIASLWGAPVRFTAALWHVLGFFAIFVAGGITGVMVASVPFDLQVHDSYFVVAHFHYVLIGGAVFPLIGGMYHWFPKIFGTLMDERLGKISFWVTFAGFNLTFFPMHDLGLRGMPRRVYTYLDGLGWGAPNLLATVGAFILAAGFGLTLANALRSLALGRPAPRNPWNAGTLEWATQSPPPNYNHPEIPVIASRWPLWDLPQDGRLPAVRGILADKRQVLVTSVLDARPEGTAIMPGPTIWPFLSALAASTGFIGLLFHPSFFVVGFVLAAATFIAWFWPRGDSAERRP